MIQASNPMRSNRFTSQSSNATSMPSSLRSTTLKVSTISSSTSPRNRHQPLPSPTSSSSSVNSKFSHRFNIAPTQSQQQFSSTIPTSSNNLLSTSSNNNNRTNQSHQLNKTYDHVDHTPSAYSILSNGGIKRRSASTLVSKRNTDMFGTYYTFSEDKTPKYNTSSSMRQDLNRSLDMSFDNVKERSKSQPRSIRKVLPPLLQPTTTTPTTTKQEDKLKIPTPTRPTSKLEKATSIKNVVTNFFKPKPKINATTPDIESSPTATTVSAFETSQPTTTAPEYLLLSRNDIEFYSSSSASESTSGSGGSDSEDEKPPLPITTSYLLGYGKNRGLKNIGNTCFMNSTLQCLCSIQPIRDYFSSQFKINPKKEGNLAKQFSVLLRSLTCSTTDDETGYSLPVNPIDFKRTLNQYTTLFRGNDQQDCQEFLRYVLDGINEDTNRIIEKPKYEELDDIANENIIDKSNRWFRNYIERSSSFVTDLFLGQLKSEIKCLVCERASVTFDPFLDICLPINLNSRGRGCKSSSSSYISSCYNSRDVSLEECLLKFTEEEHLSGIEQVYCSSCKKHQDTSKKLSFFRVPEVLVVQLKRFSNDQKLLDQVNLCELLEFNNYLSMEASEKLYNNQPITYQLMGVIKHFGSLRGGHYICQVKNAEGEWIEYNDSTVKHVHHFNTNDGSAYVLFYGRIKVS